MAPLAFAIVGLIALVEMPLALASVPTVFFPLDYRHGSGHKISTTLSLGQGATNIEVVFDTGSEDFWVFGPNATLNWGEVCLGCQGQCNASIPTFYDWPKSASASKPDNFSSSYAYGGFDKILQGSISIRDNFTFTNSAGLTANLPNLRVAIEDYMQLRQRDNGTCTPDRTYDLSIMGMAPPQHTDFWVTKGPSVRQDLLDAGLIKTSVISTWMNQSPDDVRESITGMALLGGIDTSKYTGELIKVPFLNKGPDSVSIGYYTQRPTISVNGHILQVNDSEVSVPTCLLDSGTRWDDLPIGVSDARQEAFMNATGLVYDEVGYTVWPGACDDVPANLTIDMEFTGIELEKAVTIKVPLRNYIREDDGPAPNQCFVNIQTGGCLFGAPFFAAAFIAADDERRELALAQGGISDWRSGVNEDMVVDRIPDGTGE